MDRPISAARWNTAKRMREDLYPLKREGQYLAGRVLLVAAGRKGEWRSWSGRLPANRRTRRGGEEKKSSRSFYTFPLSFSFSLFHSMPAQVRHCVMRTSKETMRDLNDCCFSIEIIILFKCN